LESLGGPLFISGQKSPI